MQNICLTSIHNNITENNIWALHQMSNDFASLRMEKLLLVMFIILLICSWFINTWHFCLHINKLDWFIVFFFLQHLWWVGASCYADFRKQWKRNLFLFWNILIVVEIPVTQNLNSHLILCGPRGILEFGDKFLSFFSKLFICFFCTRSIHTKLSVSFRTSFISIVFSKVGPPFLYNPKNQWLFSHYNIVCMLCVAPDFWLLLLFMYFNFCFQRIGLKI